MKFDYKITSEKTKHILELLVREFGQHRTISLATISNYIKEYDERSLIIVVVGEDGNIYYILSTGVGVLSPPLMFSSNGVNSLRDLYSIFNDVYEKINGDREAINEIFELFLSCIENEFKLDNPIRKLKLESISDHRREELVEYMLENLKSLYNIMLGSYDEWIVITE